MGSSSLIFLLIVVIWAAYLVQHWIRRREALATARSVDRFSEAMRVLSKREPLPQGVARMEADRTRHTAPEVTVKSARTSLRAGHQTVGDSMPQHTDQPQPKQHEWSERLAAPVKLGSGAWRALSKLNRRQVRGVALLISLAFLAISLLLTVFGAVPWWLPVLALIEVGGVVAWLRHSALAEQAARRPVRRSGPRPVVRTESVAGQVSFEDSADEAQPREERVFDGSPAPLRLPQRASSPASAEAPAASAQAQPVEGAWQPVAVPPPTYTLKERAVRPEVQPAATTTAVAAPVAPGAGEDVPFDGMAMDVEMEELPSAFRAG